MNKSHIQTSEIQTNNTLKFPLYFLTIRHSHRRDVRAGARCMHVNINVKLKNI